MLRLRENIKANSLYMPNNLKIFYIYIFITVQRAILIGLSTISFVIVVESVVQVGKG